MSYKEMIIEDTGCTPEDAAIIEDIMRNEVFHSTLDWQTREELRLGARKAAIRLVEDRPLYEEHFANVRAMFEKRRREIELKTSNEI